MQRFEPCPCGEVGKDGTSKHNKSSGKWYETNNIYVKPCLNHLNNYKQAKWKYHAKIALLQKQEPK